MAIAPHRGANPHWSSQEGPTPGQRDHGGLASGSLTADQIGAWWVQLGWSDGDGLDAIACARLLEEVVRLRLLVRQAHRVRPLEMPEWGGAAAISPCACPTCADVESDALVRAALHLPS